MPPSQPAYPTQRAFVVQLHAETDMVQARRGRQRYGVGAGDLLPDRGGAGAGHVHVLTHHSTEPFRPQTI